MPTDTMLFIFLSIAYVCIIFNTLTLREHNRTLQTNNKHFAVTREVLESLIDKA